MRIAPICAMMQLIAVAYMVACCCRADVAAVDMILMNEHAEQDRGRKRMYEGIEGPLERSTRLCRALSKGDV